jgi:hypothetical protein
MFPRESYAKTYDQLTYLNFYHVMELGLCSSNLPLSIRNIISRRPTILSIEVLDLISRFSTWTRLVQEAWSQPDTATQDHRSALLENGVYLIVEDCLYCLKVMQRENSHQINPILTSGTSTTTASPFHSNRTRPAHSAEQTVDLERILLLSLLLYGLDGFYYPKSKSFRMYKKALAELTPLLLDALRSSTSRSAQHNARLEYNIEEAFRDVLVWCTFTTAEGYRSNASASRSFTTSSSSLSSSSSFSSSSSPSQPVYTPSNSTSSTGSRSTSLPAGRDDDLAAEGRELLVALRDMLTHPTLGRSHRDSRNETSTPEWRSQEIQTSLQRMTGSGLMSGEWERWWRGM